MPLQSPARFQSGVNIQKVPRGVVRWGNKNQMRGVAGCSWARDRGGHSVFRGRGRGWGVRRGAPARVLRKEWKVDSESSRSDLCRQAALLSPLIITPAFPV